MRYSKTTMDWDNIRNILDQQTFCFVSHNLDRVELNLSPAKRSTLLEEIKRLSKLQDSVEAQADGACLTFAQTMEWPEMSEGVRDAVLLRLTLGKRLVDFLSGRKRVMNRHAVKPMKDREVALRFVLIEWWHFLGRILWDIA